MRPAKIINAAYISLLVCREGSVDVMHSLYTNINIHIIFGNYGVNHYYYRP